MDKKRENGIQNCAPAIFAFTCSTYTLVFPVADTKFLKRLLASYLVTGNAHILSAYSTPYSNVFVLGQQKRSWLHLQNIFLTAAVTQFIVLLQTRNEFRAAATSALYPSCRIFQLQSRGSRQAPMDKRIERVQPTYYLIRCRKSQTTTLQKRNLYFIAPAAFCPPHKIKHQELNTPGLHQRRQNDHLS